MPMRWMGAVLVAALAGCGGGGDVEADGGGPAAEPAAEERASRFEVSVDTQAVATPDSQVAPTEDSDE
jgi:hypothetical protein